MKRKKMMMINSSRWLYSFNSMSMIRMKITIITSVIMVKDHEGELVITETKKMSMELRWIKTCTRCLFKKVMCKSSSSKDFLWDRTMSMVLKMWRRTKMRMDSMWLMM